MSRYEFDIKRVSFDAIMNIFYILLETREKYRYHAHYYYRVKVRVDIYRLSDFYHLFLLFHGLEKTPRRRYTRRCDGESVVRCVCNA